MGLLHYWGAQLRGLQPRCLPLVRPPMEGVFSQKTLFNVLASLLLYYSTMC